MYRHHGNALFAMHSRIFDGVMAGMIEKNHHRKNSEFIMRKLLIWMMKSLKQQLMIYSQNRPKSQAKSQEEVAVKLRG